jgi:hypothetical protein
MTFKNQEFVKVKYFFHFSFIIGIFFSFSINPPLPFECREWVQTWLTEILPWFMRRRRIDVNKAVDEYSRLLLFCLQTSHCIRLCSLRPFKPLKQFINNKSILWFIYLNGHYRLKITRRLIFFPQFESGRIFKFFSFDWHEKYLISLFFIFLVYFYIRNVQIYIMKFYIFNDEFVTKIWHQIHLF